MKILVSAMRKKQQNLSAEQRRSLRRKRQRGTTIVEFSLSFLLFLTLVFGLMEGAHMVWAYTTVSHAARQGARYAIVHGGGNPVADSAIESRVRQHALGLQPSYISVSTVWSDPAAKGRGTGVQVRVSYDLRFATNLFSPEEPLRLSSTAQSVVTN